MAEEKKRSVTMVAPRSITLQTANRYANILAFLAWILIAAVVIATKMAGFLLTLLFTLFAFVFTEEIMTRFVWKNRIFSTMVAVVIIACLGVALYFGVSLLTTDLFVLLQESEPALIKTLASVGIEEKILNDLNDLYKLAGDFLRENLAILSNFGAILVNMILGVVFGILLFYHDPKKNGKYKNIWTLMQYKVNCFATLIFRAFRIIMTTQVLIALMNTVMISIFSTLITPLFYGEFLPYYYIIIPLVFLFSLVPVVGNLIVNFLIIIAALQVSVYYVIAAVIYFFIAHKLELIVVGKVLNARMDVPFVLILFSMVLGEIVFRSFAGIILGMTLLFALMMLLKSFEIKPSNRLKTERHPDYFPF